ncbi:MAG: hypothetical protein KBG80_10210 [Breznakibacter sp.]|nr:hypothetical protein [Breznakibacter sp.]
MKFVFANSIRSVKNVVAPVNPPSSKEYDHHRMALNQMIQFVSCFFIYYVNRELALSAPSNIS